MRRLPFSLVAMASALTIVSGSALAAVARSAASPPANSALPTIAGTAQEGQTLTAASGTWGGATPISYAYQWQSCNSAGAHCRTIRSASHQNYVASHSDIGNTIRVEVTATNSDGSTQALSAATAAIVQLGSAPVNTKQPNSPSGNTQDGQTLTVNDGSWSGLNPIKFSYQWQSCTAVNSVCTDLAGQTGSKFVIDASLVGAALRATVTATNSLGKASAFSNLTPVVLAKATAPANSVLPVITGTLHVGQTLQASTGTWSGLSTSTFGYQWSRCNADGSSCASISGATGANYLVGQADLAMALRIGVTATNATGSTTATSVGSVIAARVIKTGSFNAVLRAGQVVGGTTGTPKNAAGHFTAKLNGKTLTWTLSFASLTGRPTYVGLNKGARGVNGASFKTLCHLCTSPTHGTLTLTASQVDAMLAGGTYVNLRTIRNLRGELRGQINRVS